MATLLYRTLQLSLEYDTIIWHTCVMTACRQKLYVQNCGQTAADRDMFTIDRETLSLSFVPGRGGGGSLPWLVPGSFRGVVDRLWEKHEQTPAMNSQEPDHGGGGSALCWAGAVRGKWQVIFASGRRSLGWRRAKTLPPREAGRPHKICRNTSLPYPTVPSLTSYDLPFSHSTCVSDRQTERWHLTPNGRPIMMFVHNAT